MNLVHFRNEGGREDYKTAFCVLRRRNALEIDLNWKNYALKYIEKGMKSTLSYANSFLIVNLYMHNYILRS